MKPGSLVEYIGGQFSYDVECGYGLDKGAIYEIYDIGKRMFEGRKRTFVELVEMRNVSHLIEKFREIQPPGEVDIEALMSQPEPERVMVVRPAREAAARR